jgi:hypothetical protein
LIERVLAAINNMFMTRDCSCQQKVLERRQLLVVLDNREKLDACIYACHSCVFSIPFLEKESVAFPFRLERSILSSVTDI